MGATLALIAHYYSLIASHGGVSLTIDDDAEVAVVRPLYGVAARTRVGAQLTLAGMLSGVRAVDPSPPLHALAMRSTC